MKFPGIKIIDRYIIRKFLGTYFFAIALIIVVVVIFDAAEKIDDFIELKAPLSKIVLQYYLNFRSLSISSVGCSRLSRLFSSRRNWLIRPRSSRSCRPGSVSGG